MAIKKISKVMEVNFLWIPGHSGIFGNEQVDCAAKTGAKEGFPIDKVPHEDTNNHLKITKQEMAGKQSGKTQKIKKLREINAR